MFKIGITGGIGSGKSTVCRLFREFGVPVYEADTEAKRLMREEPLRSQIQACFGTLDREELGAILFSNPDALAVMDALVHPAVMSDFERFCDEAALRHPAVIMESALLFSAAGLSDHFDVTLTVNASLSTRIERVRARDGHDADQVRRRIEVQGGYERADFVIENDGTQEELRRKVERFYTYLSLYTPTVMGILNITPDSFYAGSRGGHLEGMELCDVIDVGGYSSRPGAAEVTVDEEIARVLEGLEAVKKSAPNTPVSVDTFRSEVARAVLEAYPNAIINDISAGELDPKIWDVVAEYDAIYIAMHMRGRPETMQQHVDYEDVTDDVERYFEQKITQLRAHGIDKIVIDPGFGFAKTLEQNYELLRGLHRLKKFRLPILSGVSRKSMIYNALGVSPDEALAGTVALGWESLRQGATILRVHDVREARDTVKIFETYERQTDPS